MTDPKPNSTATRHPLPFEMLSWQDFERSCLMLVEAEGCQDPVAQYLPGFDTARSRAITVEQLLTHRSGLPLSIHTSLNEYPTLDAMANAIGQRGPQFTPGSRFWYSDAGSDCLGAVIEVASGMPLDAFVRARLLEPLAMQDTYYLHEAATPASRIASLYYGKAGAWTNSRTSARLALANVASTRRWGDPSLNTFGSFWIHSTLTLLSSYRPWFSGASIARWNGRR